MSSVLTLNEWLQRLEQLDPNHIELGLKRVRAVAERMGLLSWPDTKIIETAGTNGKGSSCALIACALQHAGISYGLYTSPHLHHFTERVVINGREVSAEALAQAFAAVEEARAGIALTYFEYTTLAAFYCFKQSKVQVLVLEIGLGGRLDAVNVLDADIALIPSIGFDHMALLGHTLSAIAGEKAGIIKPGAYVITGKLDDEAKTVIEHKALQEHAVVYENGRDFSLEFKADGCVYHAPGQKALALPLPLIPYACAAGAITAILVLRRLGLKIDDQAIAAAMAHAVLPGRMQQAGSAPLIYLDVAHNVPAARNLIAQLQAKPQVAGRKHLVIGMLKDKDIEGVIEILAPNFDDFFVASLHGGRAELYPRLVSALLRQNIPAAAIQAFDDVSSALDAARQAAATADEIVVCGSFVTVADADSYLHGSR